MGRRKKKDKEKNGKNGNGNGNGYKPKKKWGLAGDTKRSIAAVFLIALAILAVFSLFGGAGTFGTYFNKILSLAFGAGRFLLPVLMIVVGFMYFRRDTDSYYVFVAGGFFVFFAAILGFIHIFYPLSKMVAMAQSGQGGGFLGAAAAYPALRLFGFSAGIIVLLALALASLLLALNVPLRALLKPVEWMKKRSDEEEEGETSISKPPAAAEALVGKSTAVRISEIIKGRTEKSAPDRKMMMPDKQRMIAGWKLPPLDLLERTTGKSKAGDIEANAKIIQETFKNFGIETEIGEISVGPSVTQYCFKPAAGIKLSKITGLNNNLSLALAQHPIRIEAPIPGKSLIGIEVPNKVSTMVRLRDFVESVKFAERKTNLTLALGQDVSGNYIFGDLTEMPHLMIAGATGTGKSVSINTIITTLLYQNSPDDLKMILIDPKRVELTAFNGIPHLLTPTVVENGKVANSLKWAIGEMERRYKMLQESASRDIFSYNEKIKPEQKKNIINEETGEVLGEEEVKRLPYIVIIIDELADIMASHSKDVEAAIVRLAQMARAVGIHLIVSTQRPSVEVLTGLIKANITTRIAFQVATQIDSRTILDMGGAEKLLGNGDMLYLSARSPKPKRIQGVFVSESEVKRVVKSIKSQLDGEVEYDEEVTATQRVSFSGKMTGAFGGDQEGDELYEEAKDTVIKSGKASASLLQRRLRVGYARAARLLDILEANGVIGQADGSKPREILVDSPVSPVATGEVQYKDELDDQKKRERWQM
ncbi:MAG TPA: DNA translocase FtsK 4TM domain-containing protein [Candidatus Saccharimonadales bacterium]|nr:DNA translocase FtsK 4TM domain-containing protein [Candidatus Saccharimonadales bacterium]